MPAATVQLNTFVAPAETSAPQVKRGWFGRLADRWNDARMRHAEREVARFIELRGGKLTDDMERRIERHFA